MAKRVKEAPNAIKRNTEDTKIDCCVMCGEPTPYTLYTPISERRFYVSGVGQVCETCGKETNTEEYPE